MASTAFVSPLGSSPSPGGTASAFTPSGLRPLRRVATARDPLRVRMGAAAAAFHPSSSSAAAAAALRAAGGVDPRSYHVASVLSRAAASGTRRRDASSSSTPSEVPLVAYATVAGGGVVGGDAAVAADAAVKSRAWAQTMAALRAAGVADLGSSSAVSSARSTAVGRAPTAAAAASAASRPVSVTVAGALRVAVSSYASRMARLSDHAAAVSASAEAEAAAVEAKASSVVARPSVGAALLAAVSGAVSSRAAPEVVPAPAQAKVTPSARVNIAAVEPSPAAVESNSIDRVSAVKPSRPSPVAPSNPTSARTPVGAWSLAPAMAPNLTLATATSGGSVASTPLPTPLPSTMASFVAAKSPEEPVNGEEVEEPDAAVSSTMRAVLPPVLTAAFVGACLALSHAAAVIGSSMTPM